MRLVHKTVCDIYYEPIVLTFTSLKNRNHNAVRKASTHTQKNKSSQQWAVERSISSTYWTQALYVVDHILCSIWFIEWVYKYDMTMILYNHPRILTFFCQGHGLMFKPEYKLIIWNIAIFPSRVCRLMVIFDGHRHIVYVNVIDTTHRYVMY